MLCYCKKCGKLVQKTSKELNDPCKYCNNHLLQVPIEYTIDNLGTCIDKNLKDQFGKGKKWTKTYTSQERPTLTQTFRIYKAFSFKLQPKLWFLVWALVARLVFPRCSSLVHQFLITWSSRDRLKGIAEL